MDFGQEQFGSQSIDERLSVLFRNGRKLLSLFLVHCRLFPEKLCDDMGWVHSPFSAAGVYVLACQGGGNTAVRSFRISSWSAILVLFFRWMVLYPSSLQFGAINVSLRSDGFAAEYPERICTLDRSGSRAGFFIDLDNSFSFWVVRTLDAKTCSGRKFSAAANIYTVCFFAGSWEMITPEKTRPQPQSSRGVMVL